MKQMQGSAGPGGVGLKFTGQSTFHIFYSQVPDMAQMESMMKKMGARRK